MEEKGKKGERKIPCEIYSRIVGYLRPIQNWNEAKVIEFHDRRVYKVPPVEELEEMRPSAKLAPLDERSALHNEPPDA